MIDFPTDNFMNWSPCYLRTTGKLGITIWIWHREFLIITTRCYIFRIVREGDGTNAILVLKFMNLCL